MNVNYTIYLTLVTLICLTIDTNASSNRSLAQMQALNKLFSNYEKNHRPYQVDSPDPVDVDVDLFINSFSDVNEIKMEYSIDLYLRQRWEDQRLNFPPGVLLANDSMTMTPDYIDLMWKPDLFISNSIFGQRHVITTRNEVAWLKNGGKIVYSQRLCCRLSLRMQCLMQFQLFPGDNQTCSFYAESYGYSTKDLKFHWHKNNDDYAAINYGDGITLPEFELNLKASKLVDCTKTFTTGEFSCVAVHFYLKRNIGFYVSQLFIPSILTVVLSWLSFFVDVRAAPARVSIGLLTVLTITTQTSGIRSQLPRVAYTKAIDVWMSVCLVFVAMAFFEYALAANYYELKLAKKRSKSMKEKISKGKENCGFELGSVADLSNGETLKNNNTGLHMNDVILTSSSSQDVFESSRAGIKKRDVDFYSKIIFPGTFVIFNIVFWVVYF